MTTANHDQLGSRCKAHIDQATRTAQTSHGRCRQSLRCSFTRPDFHCRCMISVPSTSQLAAKPAVRPTAVKVCFPPVSRL